MSDLIKDKHNPADKPVILRGTGNKLLVALLCAVSFIAGFYAHQTRQANACQAMGGELSKVDKAVVCLIK